MKLPDNLHWSRVLIVCFLFVLASLLTIYRGEAKDIVKATFESGTLTYIVWIYVFVAVLSHGYFVANVKTSHFEKVTDYIFAIATYGLAGTTSVTLLQGVFMQHFYSAQYFANFGSLDLASVGVVSLYLLVYCGVNTSKMLGDVIFQVQGSNAEPPTAT